MAWFNVRHYFQGPALKLWYSPDIIIRVTAEFNVQLCRSLSLSLSLSPQLSLKCRAPEVSQYVYQMYDSVLKN